MPRLSRAVAGFASNCMQDRLRAETSGKRLARMIAYYQSS